MGAEAELPMLEDTRSRLGLLGRRSSVTLYTLGAAAAGWAVGCGAGACTLTRPVSRSDTGIPAFQAALAASKPPWSKLPPNVGMAVTGAGAGWVGSGTSGVSKLSALSLLPASSGSGNSSTGSSGVEKSSAEAAGALSSGSGVSGVSKLSASSSSGRPTSAPATGVSRPVTARWIRSFRLSSSTGASSACWASGSRCSSKLSSCGCGWGSGWGAGYLR